MLIHALPAFLLSITSLVAPADPGAALHEKVDGQRLMDTLAALPTKRAPGPTAEHAEGLVATETLIAERLKAMGYEPVLHEVPYALPGRKNPAVYHNVIAEVRGASKPEEVILVGAHLDAVPLAPGADDNGSGTAGLLELARIFKDHKPERTIRFAFFTLEEAGLVGSTRYAGDLREKLRSGEERIVGMLSLDMLGFYSDEPESQTWPQLPVRVALPTTANFLAVGGILQHQGFSRPLIAAMQQGAGDDLAIFAGDLLPWPVPDFLRSDHAPFLQMGIPAVLVSDTANFRSPHYHRPSDAIGTIDPVRFAAAVRGLAAGIAHVADRPAFDPPSMIEPKPPTRPTPEPRPLPAAPDPAGPDPRSPVAPRPSDPANPGRPPGQGPETPR